MVRNYEIGCSLFMVDNQSFVTLFIYSSAVREKVLVGFCGKLIIKFAFEFEIEELRSDRRWIEMFLSKKDNDIYEKMGENENEVSERLWHEGENIDGVQSQLVNDRIKDKFKIMMEDVNKHIYAFLLENMLNGIVQLTNKHDNVLKKDKEEDEDCGKMVINAVTKTKKILKYIRKQRKTNIHLIKKK